MDMSYAAIEERLKEAINAYKTCKKPNKSANARESHAPYERLLDLYFDNLKSSLPYNFKCKL